MDVKATKTVAITIGTYFICYIPTIVFAVLRSQTKDTFLPPWFAFTTVFCLFISSASNPIIYFLRNGRYRSAIRQLAKEPCGRSLFQERPERNSKELGQQQKNPRGKAKQLQGDHEEPGASTRPDETLRSEARGPPSAETRQMLQADRVEIAWQGSYDNSNSSRAEQQIAIPNQQASRNGFEGKGRGKDEDFISSCSEGKVDKGERSIVRVHPVD